MNPRTFLAHNLAAAFCGGPWTLASMTARGARVIGRRERWLRPLIRRLLEAFPDPPAAHALDDLIVWICADKRFALLPRNTPVRRAAWLTPAMAPSPWPVPPLPTVAAFGDWLGIKPGELQWFADCQGRERLHRSGPLRHYRYQTIAKRGGRFRLIESPKLRLKELQRQILTDILDRIPPHDAAHGFRRGRSVASYTGPHVGRPLVLRLDLADFFPSIPASRVHALFRTAGYPKPVAGLLTGLCTNVVPDDALPESADARLRSLARSPHLPQGAPTSPALANLCAFRLDTRLAALAEAAGAAYTRYADDLAFSGGGSLERSPVRFFRHVCRIAAEEGFAVRAAKTRIMRPGVRQQLAGVVVNVRPNIRRAEFDLLKAILTNCVRHGPASQNRAAVPDFRAHLLGRIAYIAMLNPERGRTLRAIFDQIRW
jgi:hypothetical protein